MKTRELRKKLVTRRDFIAKATTFMAVAGIASQYRPFIRDFLVKNAVADTPGEYPCHIVTSSEQGGVPLCMTSWSKALLQSAPVDANLAYYSLNNEAPSLTTQQGRELLLPPEFSQLGSTHLQNITNFTGFAGGYSGHKAGSFAQFLSLDGKFDSYDVQAAQIQEKFSNFPVPTFQFRSNQGVASINVESSAIYDAIDINMTTPTQAIAEMKSVLSPVTSDLLEMNANEVTVLEAALNWVAELFGGKSVETKNMNKTIAAVEKSTKDLFLVDLADAAELTPEIISAYGLDQPDFGGEYPFALDDIPAGKQPINFALFFALAEISMANNLAPNAVMGYDSFDWHYVPNTSNPNDQLFRVRDHIAKNMKIFLDRLGNIPDPLSSTGAHSILQNLFLAFFAPQNRETVNTGGWGDVGFLSTLVFNNRPNGWKRLRPGTFGDVSGSGQVIGPNYDGGLLAEGTGGKPKDLFVTLREAAGVGEADVDGAKAYHGALTG